MSDQPALFYTFFHFPTSPAVSPCLPTAPLPYFLRRWLAFSPIFCFQPPTFAPTTQKKDRQLAVNEPRPISETLSCTGLKVVPNIVDKQLQNTQKEGAPYELDSYLASEGYWFAA